MSGGEQPHHPDQQQHQGDIGVDKRRGMRVQQAPRLALKQQHLVRCVREARHDHAP